MKESYYDYLVLLAFLEQLNYGDKKSLTQREADDFIDILDKKVKKYLMALVTKNSDDEKQMKQYIENVIDTSRSERANFLRSFIDTYSDLFYFKDNMICLDDDVQQEDITFKLEELENENYELSDTFAAAADFASEVEPLQAIGATKTIADICNFFQLEQNLEDLYSVYSSLKEKQAIALVQCFVSKKLQKLSSIPYDELSNYIVLLYNVVTYYNALEHLDLISTDLMDMDTFYKGNDFIEDVINDEFHQAIFNDNVLAWGRIKLFLEKLDNERTLDAPDEESQESENEWEDEIIVDYSDEFDGEKIVNQDEDTTQDFQTTSRIKYIFYLRYIGTLIDFQKICNQDESDIEFIKRRLLFILDDSDLKLFDNANLDKNISRAKKETFEDIDELYHFYTASHIFLIDLLEYGNDEFLMRKLFYVKTYYDLTQDIRIRRILDKYKDTEVGSKLYRAILENNYIDFKDGFEITFNPVADQD